MQVCQSPTRPSRRAFLLLTAAWAAVIGHGAESAGQTRREFDVVARRYAFSVVGSDRPEIRVSQNDLVRIHFRTEDIPHSFTIEDTGTSHYRIMRRAEPDRPVSFDFRADTPGRFRFSCTLTIDPRCTEMNGTLIVDPK